LIAQICFSYMCLCHFTIAGCMHGAHYTVVSPITQPTILVLDQPCCIGSAEQEPFGSTRMINYLPESPRQPQTVPGGLVGAER
jgi:hypothetical protein